jgi:3-oxoacyl-(acyl-carrier-protein) synthase
VGACATGYKTFGDAAEMFKPAWPGQIETELAIFGSSEAAHGRAFARPEITGFNSMGAMETRERLEKRGGRLEDGYAPLTKDVLGFWPSEGAGMGGLMRLNRMMELGLPIHAAVLGYSIMGDQGGKAHPAGLGMGGLSTLMESLRMMVEWQRADPNILRYMSLHGTGTPNNNEIEPTNLLKALEAFGFEGKLKLSAFKALLGHGLGSAGSMEIALLTRSLVEQLAPGAFNLEGRELDDHVVALGNKIEVNSEVLRDSIPAAGGQSQGFAGNNATALFRHINDQVLHEVYGYSNLEIEAYHARLSERLDRAQQWEEAVRKGDKTIGEFLSWFGLG